MISKITQLNSFFTDFRCPWGLKRLFKGPHDSTSVLRVFKAGMFCTFWVLFYLYLLQMWTLYHIILRYTTAKLVCGLRTSGTIIFYLQCSPMTRMWSWRLLRCNFSQQLTFPAPQSKDVHMLTGCLLMLYSCRSSIGRLPRPSLKYCILCKKNCQETRRQGELGGFLRK